MHSAPQPGGYETRDVSVKVFGMVILGMVGITLLGMAVALWYLNTSGERMRARDTLPPPLSATLPDAPPEPRLQVNSAADLRHYKADEEAILTTYAWIDAKGGIVRIPIERAMDLVAVRGLPTRSEAAAPAAPAAPAKTVANAKKAH